MVKKSTSTKTSPKLSIDTAAISTLAELLKTTDLTDIEYEAQGCRIRVSRNVTAHFMPSAAPIAPSRSEITVTHGAEGAASMPAGKGSVDPESHPGAVKSPMVGTVYLAPKPGADNFVSIGTHVKEGQTLAIIEAMKVMNPFKSPRAGKVTHVLIEDAHPVEYDQPLFIIE